MYLRVGTQKASTALDYFGWYNMHLILTVAIHVQCLRQ